MCCTNFFHGDIESIRRPATSRWTESSQPIWNAAPKLMLVGHHTCSAVWHRKEKRSGGWRDDRSHLCAGLWFLAQWAWPICGVPSCGNRNSAERAVSASVIAPVLPHIRSLSKYPCRSWTLETATELFQTLWFFVALKITSWFSISNVILIAYSVSQLSGGARTNRFLFGT